MNRILILLAAYAAALTVYFWKPIRNAIFHSGYGCCSRCQRTWDVVNGHCTCFFDVEWTVTTPDGEDLPVHVQGIPNDGKSHHVTLTNGGGCFPLCDECWSNLTPAQRLPYYHQLLMNQGHGEINKWPRLKAAVLNGE